MKLMYLYDISLAYWFFIVKIVPSLKLSLNVICFSTSFVNMTGTVKQTKDVKKRVVTKKSPRKWVKWKENENGGKN